MDRPRPDAPYPPLVLVIDGHDDTLALCSIALAASGIDVTAASGDQAYTRASTLCPAAIVTRWPMTNGNGSAFIDRLKSDPRTRDIPLVALYGRGQEPEAAPPGRTFATVLTHPCPPDALLAGLRSLLEHSRS